MEDDQLNGAWLLCFLLLLLLCLLIKCCDVYETNKSEESFRNYSRQRSRMGCCEFVRKCKEIIALDTEIIGAGYKGSINMLARVSLVYNNGEVYDKYVKPLQPVTDYRTPWSGIYPEDLLYAEEYTNVRNEVVHKLQGNILVGHDLVHDVNVLNLYHPTTDVKDTALYIPFRKALARDFIEKQNESLANCSFMERQYLVTCTQQEKRNMVEKIMREKPSLKKLAKVILNREIQVGAHSSVEDARAALDLYLTVAHKW